MRYGILSRGMWLFFQGSFAKHLPLLTREEPKPIMQKAKQTYREILQDIPAFDRGDRFLVNILSAAMLAGIYLNLREKPPLEAATAYYHSAMTEAPVMRRFMKRKNPYTQKAQEKLKRQAEQSRRRDNPYSWKFRYEPGPDSSSYSAYFDTCGILHLFEKLGISEIIPAMCSYDYDMAALGGSAFTRQHTLEEGGPCCDCHYRKRVADAPPAPPQTKG